MLTAEERGEIEHEMERYAKRRAVCIDAMMIVQRHRGWVSDDVLEDLSHLLSMSVDELDSVASFYNQIFRRPVGRHVIQLCDSVSCWLTGYEEVRRELETRLGVGFGGTTKDGRFTLIPIVCLGVCEAAPAVMIDHTTHTGISRDTIAPLLERYA